MIAQKHGSELELAGREGGRRPTGVPANSNAENPSKIVSGGAKGADSLAAMYAGENSIDLQKFLPDYGKYGRSAPLVRNKLIIDAADKVIAFWDGTSKGTKYSVDYAGKQGKEVKVVDINK